MLDVGFEPQFIILEKSSTTGMMWQSSWNLQQDGVDATILAWNTNGAEK